MAETTTPTPLSLIRRSGEDGLRTGAYLSALAVASGLSSYFPILSFAVLAASVWLPFYACRLSRNTYCENSFKSRFVDLWASGICTFFFGSLIQALVIYVCLRFIAPGFITDQINSLIEVYRSVGQPATVEIADDLERMRDKGLLPTPSIIAQQMIVINIFIGTVISLISASYAKLAYSSPQKRQKLTDKRNKATRS